MNDRFERFSLTLMEIMRHWHALTAVEMEKLELKGPHSMYLTTLARYPEGLTAPRLCELCGRDKSDVSRMMAILEEKRFVVKSGQGASTYRGLYRLTDEGLAAARFVQERATLAVKLAGQELSEENRQTMYDALESVAVNLRRLSREGLPDEE